MEKCWQYLDRPWKETLVDAFEKERTDPCSLMGLVTRLSKLEISSSPLLQEGREESTGKTDYQAQEPKRVYPHRVVWWRE